MFPSNIETNTESHFPLGDWFSILFILIVNGGQWKKTEILNNISDKGNSMGNIHLIEGDMRQSQSQLEIETFEVGEIKLFYQFHSNRHWKRKLKPTQTT